MEIKWYLKEEEYEKYRKHQHEYSEKDTQDGNAEGEYIGSARVGNLCFDILNWGNHLWFDLYVGGVNTGYGYSCREEYKDYPYDYADSCSFRWDDDVKDTSLEEFQKELTEYIEEHIEKLEGYVTDVKAMAVSLIDKANEELQLW